MAIKTYCGTMSPDELNEALQQRYNDGTLKETVRTVLEGKPIILLILEFYYMRIASNVSVSLLIVPLENQTKVTAISSGGSSGLLQLTFGTEKAVLKTIDFVLARYGFIAQP